MGKLQRYLDFSGVMFVALDAEGRIRLLNRRGCEVLGVSSEEALGKNWFDGFVPVEHRDRLKGVFRSMMEGEVEPFETYENPVVTKTGEERIILWRNTVLKDEEGRITGTLSSGIDVTERRWNEEFLRYVNKALRAIRGVNQLIVTEKDRSRLLDGVCRRLVETESYQDAWIILLEEDEPPFFASDVELTAPLERIVGMIRDGEPPACVKRVRETERVYVIPPSDPLCAGCPLSDRRVDRSVLTCRLGYGGEVYGVLTVSAPSERVGEEERGLFKEIVSDVSFALHAIKLEEAERRQAEELREAYSRLRERVKELTCLYCISRLVDLSGMDLDGIMRGAVTLIPFAWRYPEVACARILLEERISREVFRTDNFRETRWRQAADIKVHGERVGTAEVYYLEERPESFEGPFLKEERALIDAIAERLGGVIERITAQREVEAARAYAEAIIETVREPLVVLDDRLRVVSANRSFYQTFRVTPEETENRPLYELGNRQWGIPLLRRLLGEVLPKHTTVENFEVDHDFPDIGRRVMLLNARQLYGKEKETQMIFLAIEDITDRRRMEEELRASEARYRMIAENAADILITIDLEGRFTYVSKQFEPATGYTAEELLDRKITEVLTPESAEAALRRIEKWKSGALSLPAYTVWVKAKDGNAVPFELNTSPILQEGALVGIQIVARDITERKRRDEERETLTALLSKFVSSHDLHETLEGCIGIIKDYTRCSSVGIRILDEEGNIPYEAYTGFPVQFYESESPLNIKTDKCMCIYVVKGEYDPSKPYFTEGGSFYSNGTSKLLATVSEEEKGETRNVCNKFGYESVSLTPIRLGDRIIGVIHVADEKENMVPLENVKFLERAASSIALAMERTTAIARLRESEERNRTIVEGSSEGIILTGEGRRIIYANPVAAEIAGYDDPEELMGLDVSEFLAPEDWERIRKQFSQNQTGVPQPMHLDLRIRRRDGQVREIEASTASTKYRGESARITFFRDVTERNRLRRELEEERMERQRGLELERIRANFLASVSHELRTPLNSIIGFSDLLLEGFSGELTEEQRENIAMIRNGGETLLRFINDLLDLAKLDAEVITLKPEPTEIGGLVDEVVAELRPQILKKGLSVNVEVPSGLEAEVDPTRFKQVLRNLIDNAVKFTDSGGITLKAEKIDAHLHVSVSDTGIGIAAEKIPQLFDRYAEIDPAIQAKYGGTGLGLRICRELIELHGGEIWAESTLGEGSTFYLKIPLKAARDEP